MVKLVVLSKYIVLRYSSYEFKADDCTLTSFSFPNSYVIPLFETNTTDLRRSIMW